MPTKKKISTHKETTTEENFNNLSLVERIHFKKKLLNNLDLTFTFMVTNHCNGCTVCERICPTEAITWETSGDAARLFFDSHLCVECDKCLACPVNALKKLQLKKSEKDLKKELITMNIVRCLRCGDDFKTVHGAEAICFICKAKGEKNPNRFFTL